jgi:hypothetical protein
MKHARASYQHLQDPSGKIPKDEPVFLLRAQDPTAAEVVRFWARLNAERGCSPAMVQLADQQAERMDAWSVKKSVSDMPMEDKVPQAEFDFIYKSLPEFPDVERLRITKTHVIPDSAIADDEADEAPDEEGDEIHAEEQRAEAEAFSPETNGDDTAFEEARQGAEERRGEYEDSNSDG